MKILFIGDIYGRQGRQAVRELLPSFEVDLVIANGENAASGVGITPAKAQELFDAGIDLLTLGNHVWDRREAAGFLDLEKRIIRPENYPPGAPGRGYGLFRTRSSEPVGLFNLSGRVYSTVHLDCPFRAADRIVAELQKETKVLILDFHADATSEKQAMGWYLDGRVSAVLGTHTHVQTADERILPKGTAYITDVGMTGPHNSIIGVRKDLALERFLTQRPVRFESGRGDVRFSAVLLEVDKGTGRASGIERIQERIRD